MKVFEAFQQGIDSISGGGDRRFKKHVEFEVIILGLQLEQIIPGNRAKLREKNNSSHPSQVPKIEVRFIKGSPYGNFLYRIIALFSDTNPLVGRY